MIKSYLYQKPVKFKIEKKLNTHTIFIFKASSGIKISISQKKINFSKSFIEEKAFN